MLWQLDFIFLQFYLHVNMLLGQSMEGRYGLFLCHQPIFRWIHSKNSVVKTFLAHTGKNSILYWYLFGLRSDSSLNHFHPTQIISSEINFIHSVNQLKLSIQYQEHPNVVIKSHKQCIILIGSFGSIIRRRNNNQLLGWLSASL